MADNIDIAQRNQLNQVKVAFKNYDIPSLKECEICGEDIPIQRQKLGAVKLCIDCATHAEKQNNR
ncbi:TraR/DksA C4-type zinc finger protein [Acinetobacter pollinis]|uniref:TraR/DksA C4-type zinc finger protein n=1 Tax=Acinetobacter pollinis TaxID=2605270 RepID=A0ABU6DVB3_9GAMM|nr:TraR/DksA C4-type zinc finger protein [Acinetobacter pollinis]MBF7690847.1 TraR/DksA C4-type zinc finger protein [Acinetobacter pollinis]MBF7698492.1 TraR/DksA C4-type zinc finger protein [Acinetobacter pollinis]MEB5477617.1 TraR/DksA C4-type zinc finger protein [Acinetobacter pollinis]